jgi:hypothetical protein
MNEITKTYIKCRIDELNVYIKENEERLKKYEEVISSMRKTNNEYMKEAEELTEDLNK